MANVKNFNKMVRALEKLGCEVEDKRKSGVVKVVPPKTSAVRTSYMAHPGERGVGPLRDFAVKNWGLDLKALPD